MIRRWAGLALLVLFLWWLLPAGGASAQGAAEKPEREWSRGRNPANVPFLFSAFVLTWAAIWVYLLAIHRGQQRLRRTLDRFEEESTSR
ncbi:MAG: hypothetical protein ABIH26_10005 [Candidatus Eisenbacteria bacterium]